MSSLKHAALLLLCLAASSEATTFILEAESLEMFGGWELNANARSQSARAFLVATPAASRAPAVGAIDLPHAGQWHLWVRSKDFPADRPGTRRFTVRIGEAKSLTRFGAHGQADLEGWAWEDGGALDLHQGPNLVVLGDEVQSTARCDALVLTDNATYRPEGVPWKLAKTAAVMSKLTLDPESRRALAPPLIEKDFLTAKQSPETPQFCSLAGKELTLNWHRKLTDAGAGWFMESQTKRGPAQGAIYAESYQVLYRPLNQPPKIDSVKIYPTWDQDLAPMGKVSAGGSSVQTRLGTPTTPWTAGQCFAMRPSAVEEITPNAVRLKFPATAVGQLEATWRIMAELPCAQVTLRFTPSVPGHFSLGYHAPFAHPQERTSFLLLPFMLQGRRFPEHPAAMLSSSMPAPLALVAAGDGACAVMAEPADLPFEWAGKDNARFALGLRNEDGEAQPFIYSPVLGQPGSRVETLAPIEAHFRVWFGGPAWYESYRGIVDGVYGLKDYRQPTKASLSDTALNLLDLIRDEKASGWNARAKGPWNIESRNTVSQAAPLTYLSYYLLTGDADIYNRFARPSLEYLLSRPSPHFAVEREIWDNYYQHQPMRGPAPLFGARWFAAASTMIQGRAPAFAEYLLDSKGDPRLSSPHGHTQSFEDALALYTMTGEQKWLDRARTEADRYIAANIDKLPEKDLGTAPFVNVSFVPDWEGLLHLYEATHERQYLDAAAEGARWLLTTLWVRPQTTPEITINPGGVYDAQRHLWWWGDRLYRRGIIDIPATDDPPYPPAPHLPERLVPAWTVSNIGLGLEQPSTFNRNGPRAHVLMSNWAPNLLRLAWYTGDPAFRTAARNAMIGRFGNYPGYYLDGFSDEYHRPDYPLTGPDITSLYIHHVPPFAASVIDYLYTDAETRSEGEIKFPSVRQCGYVWFDNRLFGHAPGQVYGQTAWPWMHRTAVTVDNVNIDRVLAEGGGKLFVILMNQSHAPAMANVRFDKEVLGLDLHDAEVKITASSTGKPTAPLRASALPITLPGDAFTVLTVEGVKLDIPTHRLVPPAHLPIPNSGAIRRLPVPGTKIEAVGAILQAPPFTSRDLYVYFTAQLDEAKAARLHYRLGETPEQTLEVQAFPFEFTAPLPPGDITPTWWAEIQLPNNTWQKAE